MLAKFKFLHEIKPTDWCIRVEFNLILFYFILFI
jgi:hypothetical protein